MVLRANAKINLSLDILGTRPDGYHEVRMVMQMLELSDGVTLSPCAGGGIELASDLAGLPTDERNLAVRAARLLMEEKGVTDGLRIRLEKRIPMAAGLAGGSSDAAQTMIGVNRIFKLGFTTEALMERGKKIGADVPYCILGGTALAGGIGEVLTPLPPMPDAFVLLAKPDIGVSTGEVYRAYDSRPAETHPDTEAQIRALRENSLSAAAAPGVMENVLESVTGRMYPIIGVLEDVMRKSGALAARMSGSGPTVFGIFEDRQKAEMCRTALTASYPSVWTCLTSPAAGRGDRQ